MLFHPSRRRHTRCRYVTGVQTCALPSKQKTAYEMSLCDWSSDVCSSDLHLSTLTELSHKTLLKNAFILLLNAVLMIMSKKHHVPKTILNNFPAVFSLFNWQILCIYLGISVFINLFLTQLFLNNCLYTFLTSNAFVSEE